MKPALIYFFICVNALAALAQSGDEKPPLPPGPLIRAVQDLSTWQVTYAYGDDKKKEASPSANPTPAPVIVKGTISMAVPRRITLTRTKPLWVAMVDNVDGRKYEEWSDGYVQIFRADGAAEVGLVPKDSDGVPMLPNFGAMGFPDMEWISDKTYSGVQTVGGRQCLVFTNGSMTAWVDVESRFPLRWQQGQEIRGFVQLAPPNGMIVRPPDVHNLSQAVRRDRERQAQPYTP